VPLYSSLLRPVLFRLGSGDPEVAHHRTISALRLFGAVPGASALRRVFAVDAPRTVFGLRFPNPVGLAAGMDKNGVALPGWAALGFGHVEVGTVTWHPQPGNPKPRLYRLPASHALINRMGFNNDGARALAARLRTAPDLPMPVGISIGKSKVTPNVSSPNTPGLRGLQDRGLLDELLAELTGEAARLAYGGVPKPVLVKIAPDLDDAAIGEIIEVCGARSVAGIIATNTTLARDGLAAGDVATGAEAGGLSGRPLAARALAVVSFVRRESAGRLPIVGVGGIGAPQDAVRMLDAGASLVQVYTGFIYGGPELVRGISRAACATG
jgi:dihydroorotate dehydrogenase